MPETLTGGCLCGAVRYVAEAAETLHYLCHCADCQRYGGGPFHSAIVVAGGDLKIEGTPMTYTRVADSGRTIARHFCGNCGGHLFTSPWPEATRYSVKAGTLDEPARFAPRHEIWCKSRLGWAALPDGMEAFDEGFTRSIAIGTAAVAPKEDRF